MLKFGLSKDIDVWPLMFPFEAGWAFLPSGTEMVTGTLAENEGRLLRGEIEVALIGPATYAENQADLYLLPTPVRASDLASDAICLISKKRPDQLEKPVVASAPSSRTGQFLLKLLAGRYYGFEPEILEVATEALALQSLNNNSDICILSGEAALKASPVALSRGYFTEDLTKAWWILTGVPLPVGLFGLRRKWVEANKNEAEALIRKLLQSLRSALQHSRDQRATLLMQAAKQSGLALEMLDGHYSQQRYELREPQLRGLFEFYRRAAEVGLPLVKDPAFFPPVGESPKVLQGLRAKPAVVETLPSPNRAGRKNETGKRTSPREKAQAQGLLVIQGGKSDKAAAKDSKHPLPNEEQLQDEPLRLKKNEKSPQAGEES